MENFTDEEILNEYHKRCGYFEEDLNEQAEELFEMALGGCYSDFRFTSIEKANYSSTSTYEENRMKDLREGRLIRCSTLLSDLTISLADVHQSVWKLPIEDLTKFKQYGGDYDNALSLLTLALENENTEENG